VGGDEGFQISAVYLVEYEGMEKVRDWLYSLIPEFEVVAAQAFRRFNLLYPMKSSVYQMPHEFHDAHGKPA
jgi:hypothetical protein